MWEVLTIYSFWVVLLENNFHQPWDPFMLDKFRQRLALLNGSCLCDNVASYEKLFKSWLFGSEETSKEWGTISFPGLCKLFQFQININPASSKAVVDLELVSVIPYLTVKKR